MEAHCGSNIDRRVRDGPRRRFAEAGRLFGELDYPLDLADARFAFARSLLKFGEMVGGRTELERARLSSPASELVEGPAPAG